MSQTNPGFTETWQFNVPLAVGTGVLTTLVRPADLSPWLIRGTHLVMGAMGLGVGAVADLRPEEAASEPRSIGSRAGWGSALGLLTAGTSVAGVWVDGAIERSLAKRGVRRPRLWMGVGAAAMSLGMWGADRRRTRADERIDRPSEPDAQTSA